MKEQILAVQRMQDFIENNKSEEISLSDLARASLFSPWYAYRLFRDYLGLTPTEYIRKYRLTQAAKRLRSGKVKVIDPHHRERDGSECARTRYNIRIVPGWEVCDPEHPVGQEVFEIGGRIIESSKTPDAQTQCRP